MTDKLSERAEQLARSLVEQSGFPYGYRAQWVEKITPLLTVVIQSLTADSANLARGVALEQAAQLCDDARHKHGEHHALCTPEAIRSLAPDAAQALAAHDAAKDAEIKNALEFGLQIVSALGYRITDLEKEIQSGKPFPSQQIINEVIGQIEEGKVERAEIERRARLDEHLECCVVCLQGCDVCPRAEKLKVAALAKSQPAPAKEDK